MTKAITTSAEKAKRVDYIVGMMAENKYRTRVTVRELALKWKVSVKTVEGYANEAARTFKVGPEEREEIRARHAVTFEAWAHQAATTKSLVTGLPDLRTAGDLLERHAKYCGVDVEADKSAAPTERRVVIVLGDADEPEPKE